MFSRLREGPGCGTGLPVWEGRPAEHPGAASARRQGSTRGPKLRHLHFRNIEMYLSSWDSQHTASCVSRPYGPGMGARACLGWALRDWAPRGTAVPSRRASTPLWRYKGTLHISSSFPSLPFLCFRPTQNRGGGAATPSFSWGRTVLAHLLGAGSAGQRPGGALFLQKLRTQRRVSFSSNLLPCTLIMFLPVR